MLLLLQSSWRTGGAFPCRSLLISLLGCKIKALRAKTNTYIKTPVRGEDPVFIITGRPEDVSAAKREVLAAAEHFTQIRAAKNAHTNSRQSPTARNSPDCQEKITVYVKVPYRVVGLVVGPKGATIKRIQQITNTHIVTPSRDKEPCFEVSGKPDEVDRAKREIESYIAMRTGGCHDSDNDSDYGSLMSPPLDCIFSPGNRKVSDTNSRLMNQFSPRSSASPPASTTTIYGVDPLDGGGFNVPSAWGGEPSTRSPLSSAVFNSSRVGRSRSFNEASLMTDNAPPLSAPIYPMGGVFDFADYRDLHKDESPSPTTTSSSSSSDLVISPKSSPQLSMMRRNSCCICREKDVVAALVPCGHNLFCSSCAQLAVGSGCCPVCSSHVTSMLRIYTN